MTGHSHLPVAGIIVAIGTCAVMLFAGSDLWLTCAVALVWVASLWLAAPPRAPASQPVPEGLQLTNAALRDLIEHSAIAMLMLDGERIIIANAAARDALGEHVVDQDARVALRHPSAVDLLARSDGGSATIHGLTGPRSSWQMSRQPVDARYSLIELTNRTAESDVSRAHTDFVANASHELRTPLSSIIGYVETLTDDGAGVAPAQAARFLSTILAEARRLQALIADLMSLSRVEAEKHDQPRERVDLTQLVRQASRDGAGADRQDRLAFELPDRAVIVRGDRQQLEQLVRNLVDNALKYGKADGPVTLAVKSEDPQSAVLTVRDEGEGIASEHLPHVTRRFYRTDPGRSRAVGGTGLGLAIVKHIVERHRGQLDIASTLGAGTTVTVRLPQVD